MEERVALVLNDLSMLSFICLNTIFFDWVRDTSCELRAATMQPKQKRRT